MAILLSIFGVRWRGNHHIVWMLTGFRKCLQVNVFQYLPWNTICTVWIQEAIMSVTNHQSREHNRTDHCNQCLQCVLKWSRVGWFGTNTHLKNGIQTSNKTFLRSFNSWNMPTRSTGESSFLGYKKHIHKTGWTIFTDRTHTYSLHGYCNGLSKSSWDT